MPSPSSQLSLGRQAGGGGGGDRRLGFKDWNQEKQLSQGLGEMLRKSGGKAIVCACASGGGSECAPPAWLWGKGMGKWEMGHWGVRRWQPHSSPTGLCPPVPTPHGDTCQPAPSPRE